MPNPLFQQFVNGYSQPQMQPNNPLNRMSRFYQAMQNPQPFVMNAFPDIPNEISNDPFQILQYLQKTRNITNSQVQQIMNQMRS